MPLPEETFGALHYLLIDECQFDVERMGKELSEKKILTQPLNLDVCNILTQ
jgi:TBCC domain-containing protein 1